MCTTLFAVFFSLGLVVGHGVGVFPALIIIMYYLLGDRYDGSSVFVFAVVPMAFQWLIIVSLAFLFFAKRK